MLAGVVVTHRAHTHRDDIYMQSTLAAAAGAAVGVAVGVYLCRSVKPPPKPRLKPVITDKASPAAGHCTLPSNTPRAWLKTPARCTPHPSLVVMVADSQAIINGGEVFVSGLLPITPDGTKLADKSFEVQANTVLDNLGAILEAAGSSYSQLLQVRVYISSIDDWGTFNKLYEQRLGAHKPARAVVPVPCLHYGFMLEVEAMAAHSLSG